MPGWHDYGLPVSDHPDILGAVELVRRLYVDLGQGTGGPLHVVLDDDNISDEFLDDTDERFAYLWDGQFEKWASPGEETSEEYRQAIQDTCRGILYAFNGMNEAERACVLAWHWGSIKKKFPEWYTKVWTGSTSERARERADQFVHDALAARQKSDPIAKPCTPVPCPPFTEADFSRGFVAASPPRQALTEADQRPGPDITQTLERLLDGPSTPRGVNIPQWQHDAWAKMPEVLRKLGFGGDLRISRVVEPSFTTDVEQILMQEQGKPPHVVYRGAPLRQGTDLQAMLEACLADPQGAWDSAPLVIGVPKDVDAGDLVSAIALCQRVGLMPQTPHGVLLLPEDLEG